ncbi:MAG: glycogen debranching enzyme N-terminal domain-containing protein, partial [Candidatus Bathyarchaeota archaeon]|nr:glycogen debranching enzyme N-terminal domain-containing protein [Candidatus Bathyarchaeota archaeon]
MDLPAITFPKGALSRFGELIEKEWLITNGLGSYASSTVPGINTRKYHGLLVAALDPPGNRTVCLSKLDEDIFVGNDIYRLGSNEFHDMIYPEGYKLINQFSIDPFPTYSYDLGNVQVTKKFFMPKNKNAVAITYKLTNKNNTNVKVRLYPLLTCRYYHTVVYQARIPLNFNLKSAGTQFQATFQRPQATIVCRSTDGEFKEKVNWINHLHYRDEALRGEADVDDCFQPGYFEVQVPANVEKEFAITCAVSHESQEANEILDAVGGTLSSIKDAFNQELNQRAELLSNFHRDHPQVPMSDWLNWILLAADSFIVENAAGRKAVIAGYHWFETWGRDTFISLPGLLLVTGKYSDAKDTLQSYIEYCKSGLIPNFISDKSGIPVYDTVDATLWYVNAVLQYVKYTGDFGFVKDELWEKLQAIVENHQKGTLFGIHLDEDGLLMHGPRLTWMDASVGTDVITPRTGKAVEIQALWYNTLRTMELLANKFEEPILAGKYSAMANQTRQSFNEKFWNPQNSCLFDVVNEKSVDPSIRPNQIFAVSLEYTMLDSEKCQKVVTVVNRELVTPYGLRTLSLGDPKFVGKCAGDSRSRDMAYHNGTIWPWLLGPYVTAYLKVNDYNAKSREQMLQNLVLPLFTTKSSSS